MESIVYSFLGVLIISSAYSWWRVGLRLQAHEPPIEFRERTPPPFHWFVIALTALWIALQLVLVIYASLEPRAGVPSLSQVQATCIEKLVILFVLLNVLAPTLRYRLSDFGIDLRRFKEQIVEGANGFLISLLPVFSVLLLMFLLDFRKPEEQHSFFKLLNENPGWQTIFWITAAAVICAPLAEELIFRVILQGWLQTKIGARAAILSVAVIFSAIHGLPDAIPLLPLALVLGYVFHQRNSFVSVVVLHALFNLTNLLIALMALEIEPAEACFAWFPLR